MNFFVGFSPVQRQLDKEGLIVSCGIWSLAFWRRKPLPYARNTLSHRTLAFMGLCENLFEGCKRGMFYCHWRSKSNNKLFKCETDNAHSPLGINDHNTIYHFVVFVGVAELKKNEVTVLYSRRIFSAVFCSFTKIVDA